MEAVAGDGCLLISFYYSFVYAYTRIVFEDLLRGETPGHGFG